MIAARIAPAADSTWLRRALFGAACAAAWLLATGDANAQPAAPAATAASSAAATSAPAEAASAPATPASAPAAAAPASAPTVTPFGPAPATTHSPESVQIADPYIELHTGPGRGFPIFYVAPRGQWIEIQLRHTDWFRVRTEDGKYGWVTRQQLESTLTAAGSQKTFKDILVDDYLARKVQLGASWGHFKSEPMLKVWTSYRFTETLSIEATYGQVQGVFSGTDLWHVNLVTDPWADRRISPFFTIGAGRITNFPNQSLIGATTSNATLGNAGVGIRYYITDRFVARADYTFYTALISDSRTSEFKAWTLGLSFFF